MHRSLNKPCRVIILVRPCCRAVGTQEQLGEDDEGHIFQGGELTELSSLCCRPTNRREASLFACQSLPGAASVVWAGAPPPHNLTF